MLILFSISMPKKHFRNLNCTELIILFPGQLMTPELFEAPVHKAPNPKVDTSGMMRGRKVVYLNQINVADENNVYVQLMRTTGVMRPPCRIWMEGKKLKGEILEP